MSLEHAGIELLDQCFSQPSEENNRCPAIKRAAAPLYQAGFLHSSKAIRKTGAVYTNLRAQGDLVEARSASQDKQDTELHRGNALAFGCFHEHGDMNLPDPADEKTLVVPERVFVEVAL